MAKPRPTTLPAALSALRQCQQRYAELASMQARQMPAWLVRDLVDEYKELATFTAEIIWRKGTPEDNAKEFERLTGHPIDHYLE